MLNKPLHGVEKLNQDKTTTSKELNNLTNLTDLT